ncbi:Holliday junction branch migration protein RuvA [uncultured Pseudokineococcus sp.]|uniref:Holliday junction branch migration protein RuvA n=1 Tax=uncultured Pseudokineococcus sp. TaxID=1642928 RepID=UPI002605F392|nr:Holliday junction branch migration protein RuvA [uncultured Pseudokineococcus sp.]
MIASVRGPVASVRLDAAVVVTGGVGLLVHATPAVLATLRVGTEAELATSMVVREDSLTLYGFADDDERAVFEMLQTVSGVGPRLALAMLAVHAPDGLRAAVAAEDLTALCRVPGIGRKGAQRLVLELGDRLGPAREGGAGAGPAPAPAPAAAPVADGGGPVVEALMGLGWTARAAAEAVAAVAPDEGQEDDRDVAAVLRDALRHLGRGR